MGTLGQDTVIHLRSCRSSQEYEEVATPVLGGRSERMSGRTPSAARTSGTPSIIMSPDPRPWTQIRLGTGKRNVNTNSVSQEAADDLNHNVFTSSWPANSMRRIPVGIEVVRPRCA